MDKFEGRFYRIEQDIQLARWLDAELFEERAAIREFDGGMDVVQAEAEAAQDVIKLENDDGA